MTCMDDQGGASVASSEDVARAMDTLRSVVQALRISNRRVQQVIGISGAQLFVLQQLEHSPARSMNELADRTSTHQSSVSVVVARLASLGLVMREPAREDRRRLEISITPAGRELLSVAPQAAQARIVAALRHAPPDQVRALADALRTFVHGMGLNESPGSMFLEEDDAVSRRSTPLPTLSTSRYNPISPPR
jgi:DNA-binding MarR family transcriptional regulator